MTEALIELIKMPTFWAGLFGFLTAVVVALRYLLKVFFHYVRENQKLKSEFTQTVAKALEKSVTDLRAAVLRLEDSFKAHEKIVSTVQTEVGKVSAFLNELSNHVAGLCHDMSEGQEQTEGMLTRFVEISRAAVSNLQEKHKVIQTEVAQVKSTIRRIGNDLILIKGKK